EFQHFRRLRDSTSVGHVRPTHADTKRLLYPTLYVLTALAALSACWQTAQWIKQAEVFEGLGPVGALFMTGIVISGGVGVPLAWYSLFETDSDRKQFFSLIMKTSAVSVAVWIAMFVLVAWSEDRVFFLMNNGTIGSWFSIATLGSFASFGKALMLPAGILAECTASVAIKLGISRMQDQRSTKEFVSSPHREALSKLAAEAERKVIQRREEVAKLVATRESFDLGLKVFIASCQAEHRLHIDGLEADQLAFRTNRIRNKGGK
ncbi:MAG: hypothetical protein J0H99_24425, partial [Rhodospirillales bacterium]|nr:hypothetical protein [Rhodospirillales bacterium]